MTYFLPQANSSAPVLVPPGPPQTPNNALIQSTPSAGSHNPSTNSNSTGRRSSPPSNNSNNTSSHGASIHTTAVPLQTFSSSVPLSENTPGPQALYALPPSVYPNVLPYSAPTAGFYQPLPHHPQPNTIISSVIPHSNAHPTSTLPSTPHSFQSNAGPLHGGEVVTHFPFNQSTQNPNNSHNAASTPQSAPSTPLSLTTVPPSFKNPPLFATPPILTASTIPGGPVHIAHYDEKKHYGGYVPKKFNNNGSGILTTPSLPHNVTKPSSNGNQRQTIGGYQGNTVSAQGKKNINYSGSNNINNSNSTNNHTHSEDTNSLSNSSMSNNYTSNRLKNSSSRDQTSAGSSTSSSYQPKPAYVPKGHQHQTYSANNNGSNSNSPNSNDNSEGSKYVPQHRGPSRVVPPSLDLKRNNSNTNVMTNNYHQHRSTPSTNSTESNNSPNSITSFDHSRSYHYTQYPTTAPGGTHFYRGGSAGAVNTAVQVSSNSNNNQGDATAIQTCFPFNVHSQNAGTSTPLLDSCHHQLIGYNNPMAGGMYVKFGQAFTFANVRLIIKELNS